MTRNKKRSAEAKPHCYRCLSRRHRFDEPCPFEVCMNCGGVHPDACRKPCWNCHDEWHTIKECKKEIRKVPPVRAVEYHKLDPYGIYRWSDDLREWELVGKHYHLETLDRRVDRRTSGAGNTNAHRRLARRRSRSPSRERPLPHPPTPSLPVVAAPAPQERRVDAGEKKVETPLNKSRPLKRGGLQIKGRAQIPLPSPPRLPAVTAWHDFHRVATEQERAESERFQREMAARKEEEDRTGVRNGPSYTFQETFKPVHVTDARRVTAGSGGVSIRGAATRLSTRDAAAPASDEAPWKEKLRAMDEEQGWGPVDSWADTLE